MFQNLRGIPRHHYVLLLALLLSSPLQAVISAQSDEVMHIVEKVIERQEDFYLKMDNWRAIVTTTTTKMDKHWQAEEVMVVKKKIQVVNMEKDEVILEAIKTKNGISQDMTEEYIEKSKKQQEESKKKEYEQNLERRKEKKENKTELKADDLLPFSDKKKMKYIFSQLEDSEIDGRPVYVIQALAKVKRDNRFSGRYYISQDTYDILRIHIWPSKNPRFVKELDITIDVDVNPRGYYAIKRSKIRVNGGFLFIKRVRMITEEEYSDYTDLSDVDKIGENPEVRY